MSCKSFWLVLALAFFAQGCVAETVIDVRGRDAQITPQVAVVRTWSDRAYVVRVNGRQIPAQTNRRVVVEPGEIKLGLVGSGTVGGAGAGTNMAAGFYVGPGAREVTFNAKAGHEYELGWPFMWMGQDPYVQDITADKPVTDYKVDGEPAKVK
jgi:hypothetical protein